MCPVTSEIDQIRCVLDNGFATVFEISVFKNLYKSKMMVEAGKSVGDLTISSL